MQTQLKWQEPQPLRLRLVTEGHPTVVLLLGLGPGPLSLHHCPKRFPRNWLLEVNGQGGGREGV